MENDCRGRALRSPNADEVCYLSDRDMNSGGDRVAGQSSKNVSNKKYERHDDNTGRGLDKTRGGNIESGTSM